MNLYPYQEKWIADDSRFIIGCWSRQIGKTHSTTLKIAMAMARAAALAGTDEEQSLLWVILSRGQRQSDEAMRAVKAHLSVMRSVGDSPAIRGALEREIRVQFSDAGIFDGERIRQGEIELPGNVRCIGLPANPDTARGYSANVYLDEFAFHQNSREIWQAVFPIITRGDKKLIITSTPNGKSNKFYELWSGGGARDSGARDSGARDSGDSGGQWSRHRVTLDAAVAAGCPVDVAALRAGIRDDDVWAQEYNLEFLDEASAWLPHDLISRCEHADAGDIAKHGGGLCYIGVDIARRNDLWVSVVLEKVGDVLWVRELQAHRNISFAAQFEILAAQHKRYNISRANYDQTGIGEMPTEEAKRRFGEYRSEGVLFTAAEKLDMATRLKATMDDGRLRIPVDGALRADLHALRCITGATGNARFVVDNDTDGHADRTWALALACRAADAGEAIYDYRAVPKFKAFKNSLRNSDDDITADHLPVAAPKKRNLRGSAASFFHPPR